MRPRAIALRAGRVFIASFISCSWSGVRCRSLVDRIDRLLERGGRNGEEAGVGLAEFEDEKDPAADGKRAGSGVLTDSLAASAEPSSQRRPQHSTSLRLAKAAARV